MRLLGFEYESVGGFILYFIIASIVSYPMNLVAGAFPKALLNLDRITREMAVCMYVLLDTITTFFGFYIVDYFMPSVSANTISLIVLALVFALFGISDVKKKESWFQLFQFQRPRFPAWPLFPFPGSRRIGRLLCSSGFRFQYPRHFVGGGGRGIFLEIAGHDKDGIAHADFRHAVGGNPPPMLSLKEFVDPFTGSKETKA